MLKNSSMRFLEDSKILTFFATRPFEKISFLANFVKVYSVRLNAYI